MAYALPTNSVIEVTLPYTVNAQRCMSVFHYQLTSGTAVDGGAAIVLLLNALNVTGKLFDCITNLQSDEITVGKPRGQHIYPSRHIAVEVTAVYSTGEISGEVRTQQVAAAVTKRSDLANRHGIGTLHLGGLADTMFAGGYINTAYETQFNALEVQLAATITTSGPLEWRPVIFNRASPGTSLFVTQATTQDTSRTMRRRVVGRGI